MKPGTTSAIASILSILLLSFHFTDDVVHGISPGVPTIRFTIPVLVVWLYATLLMHECRLRYVIIIIGSLGAACMPVLHMMGPIDKSSGFFFVWTLIALGVTGVFSVIVAVRAMRSLQNGSASGSR